MELRKLQANDLFLMVRIISGIGFKEFKNVIDTDEIAEARKKASDEKADVSEIAGTLGVNMLMSILGVVIEHLPEVENDVYKFVGGVANMKASDVAKMDLCEFMDVITAIFKKEEFADFFKRASKLIK